MNDPAVKGLEAMFQVRERGGPSYLPLCHFRVDSCVPPPARRFSGSGSESDSQEPVPTVFVDHSVKCVNPGVARSSFVSGAETDLLEFVPSALVGETAKSCNPGVARSSFVLVRRLICWSLFPLPLSVRPRSLAILGLLVLPSFLVVFLVLPALVDGLAILPHWLKEASQRVRLQVRVTGILDCFRQLSLSLTLIHPRVLHVLGLRLLLSQLLVHLHLVLLLPCTRVTLFHPCTLHLIQGELVVSCQCRGPLATVWVLVARVQPGGTVPKVRFSELAEDLRPVSEVEAGGKFFGGPAVYGGRLQVLFPEGNQAQVPGR